MSKFKIKYINLSSYNSQIEAKHIDEAIEKFREKNKYCAIESVEYIYEGKEEPQEWYCIWWNGNSWESKVVIAHDEYEIKYNIKASLDYSVYRFMCCLNRPECIERVHRSIWD